MSASFRAMGTDVTVTAPGLDPAAEEALCRSIAEVFEESERRYSRFRPGSELWRLNRATGPLPISGPLFAALRRARAYFEATSGLFDPAVGSALVAAGYDRSFAPGVLDRAAPSSLPPRARFSDVMLDEASRTAQRPPHVHIDLGGFIKGYTVDRAAKRLPAGAAVDAGGDAVVRGAGPGGDGWRIDVEDPRDPDRALLSLRVWDRAVATSAPNRRRWKVGDREHHHLIDPRTWRSTESDLAQVTVLASGAEVADVLAKSVFLLGSRAGRRFLSDVPGAAGVLVRADGDVELVGALEVIHDD